MFCRRDMQQIFRGKFTVFRTQPPNVQPMPLTDMRFSVQCPLAPYRMPPIRFLYIGSYVCSTLSSDPTSRWRPCASQLLHIHRVVAGTFTPNLSCMPGTPMWVRAKTSTHMIP
jgi:hypothetical protein